jgi:hypothetical protein
MIHFIKSFLIILPVVAMLKFSAYADGIHEGGDGHFDPDSLEIVTVSGSVVVDSTMMYTMYYLDENGDNEVDYHLNFGPSWYEPDSSLATRPENGEEVTIYGGLYSSHEDSFKIVIVYEINGLFWRQPSDALWNNMGGHHGNGGHHTGHGYAFGWMHDTPEVINVNGKVLVDTTFIHEFFYLDENEDDHPDYFLNFGPPWYEPVSGIQRPAHGQSVSIFGAEIDQHTIPMLNVYNIDGQVWRDSSSFGSHFGGGWIDKDMSESRHFHTPFDTLDRMEIEPGWHGGMGHGHGGMMSDSLFCQILEIFPQNIPNSDGQHIFAAYEVGMYNPDGSNNMWMGGMNGGHMNFNSNVDFMLHYNDIQLQGEGIDENSIEVKYWDDLNDHWVTVSDIVVDPENNTVSYSDNEISNFVILTGPQVATSITGERLLTVKGFNLKQNYPNPFNPATTIAFSLSKSAFVTLSIYNVLGQKIMVLLDNNLTSGSYKVEFDARHLPSGTYFYELSVDNQRRVKKLSLMK